MPFCFISCLLDNIARSRFVTHLHFWDGPTIVSGSSDRSISLWDSRIGAHPYLSLKYHNAPISDILIGSKRDYSIISAGADGIVACWDLRNVRVPKDSSLHEVMSRPQILMHHKLSSKNALRFSESIYLASGLNYEKNLLQNNTLVSVGVDGSVNEWDLNDNGKRLAKDVLLHTDAVSVFRSFTEKDNLIAGGALGGFLSSSWDGSVRVRSLQMNNSKN
jgi:WD40 repeat protein